jgi:hypothetical protein
MGTSTRITGLVTGEKPRAARYGRLYADPRTVEIVRLVARAERWGITQCLDELLRAYVELRRPEWRIVEGETKPILRPRKWARTVPKKAKGRPLRGLRRVIAPG